MQSHRIARPTSFGPTELKMIFRAFDDAWGAIAPKVGSDPVAVETARMSLATIVLGMAANTGPATTEALTALAVKCSAVAPDRGWRCARPASSRLRRSVPAVLRPVPRPSAPGPRSDSDPEHDPLIRDSSVAPSRGPLHPRTPSARTSIRMVVPHTTTVMLAPTDYVYLMRRHHSSICSGPPHPAT
jgi:hypothetical protein